MYLHDQQVRKQVAATVISSAIRGKLMRRRFTSAATTLKTVSRATSLDYAAKLATDAKTAATKLMPVRPQLLLGSAGGKGGGAHSLPVPPARPERGLQPTSRGRSVDTEVARRLATAMVQFANDLGGDVRSDLRRRR